MSDDGQQDILTYNARITKTFMGVEDHGMWAWHVELVCERGNLTFGQVQLTEWAGKDKPERVLPWSVSAMLDTLRVLEVWEWEHLVGTSCRIQFRNSDRKVIAIGHFMFDNWVFPEEYYAEKRGE